MKTRNYIHLAIVTTLFFACNQPQSLPILGNRQAIERQVDGKTIVDTLYSTVPNFSFMNQNGDSVTQLTTQGKIYVADFFFTTCPTICPIMKKQMIRVYQKIKGDPSFMLLSHTIDPDHDTLALLKDYCERLGSDGKQWMFLTGNRDQIYEMAEKGYYATAMPDSTEPGGYIHSGGFILVDAQRRVRGIYNGTEEKEVDQLMQDLFVLKAEK
jgi:protein SCO1/2